MNRPDMESLLPIIRKIIIMSAPEPVNVFWLSTKNFHIDRKIDFLGE